MFYLIVRLFIIVLFKLFFRLEAKGSENIPLKGGFILAANHVSYLDPPVLAAACPRVLSFLAKEELFKNRLFGHFLTSLNVFPLKSQASDIRSLRWAIKVLKEGKPITIFPEGRRTYDGKLDKPQRGVGLLAAKADVPIIPAFIDGSIRALPRGSNMIRLHKIKVYFAQGLSAQNLNSKLSGRDLYQALAEEVMEQITQLQQVSQRG